MNDLEEFQLSSADHERLETLTCEDLELIDKWLIMHATDQWKKTAMVVMQAIGESDKARMLEDVSDLIFGIRVEALIAEGSLLVQGNVRRMRYSEIKLPEKKI